MYRVIVADDEPAALKHICTIIERKCPNFEVIATADNGESALQKVRELQPEVLISDIKMPIIDGIALTYKVKEQFPQVLSVIVSGYQDFEYAKGAIRSGVCDYILKPVTPSALKEVLDKLELTLMTYYYERRNKLIRNLCTGCSIPSPEELVKVFPDGTYYVAIMRKNAVPSRFSSHTGIEIFSIQDEKMIVYGRDEMESLYICPKKLLYQTSFTAMILKTIAKMADNLSFITAIIRETPLSPDEFPAVIKELYHKLDKSIIIGKNQTLFLDQLSVKCTDNASEENHFDNLEYLIQQNEYQKFKKEIQILLKRWETENRSQLWIENKIKHIFYLMQKFNCMHETQENVDYMLDDAFSYAATMDNLCESIMGIINQSISEKIRCQCSDKADIYREIIEYLNRNISDELSIQVICKKFGLSQTTLSKLFRTYADCSFNNYLTNIRIEKAKSIISKDKDIFVKDIANRVGYSDQFYFSRIFHSVTGLCPSDYIGNYGITDKT